MPLPIRRPGKGGGYLNNVAGVIQSIIFAPGKSGENEYGPWMQYSAKLTILPDGAEKATTQFAPAGFLRGNNTISKDGTRIEGDDAYSLEGNQPFGKFVVSLVEGEGNRFPEERLGDLRSYDAVAGTRVVFERKPDAEETERKGKRTFEGRDGKEVEVDQDVLLVKEVLALPNEKVVKGAKATKGASTPKGAATAAAAAADTDATDAALKAILGAAPNRTLSRSKVSSSVIGYAIKAELDGAAREAIRTQLSSDAYIADAVKRELIVVEGEGKTANLILATD